MMETQIATLARCDLAGTGWARDLPPGMAGEPEDIATRYDQTTLWYDAFWHRGQLTLVVPKPYNLAPLLTAETLRIDGAIPRRIRHASRERHDVLRIPCRSRPAGLEVETGQGLVETPVNDLSDADFFAGLNTGLLLSKNNDLAWIEDFARYHVNAHGMQAVLFFDNGSDRYGLDEIARALERAGVARAMMLSVPFPYGLRRGRTAGGKADHSSKFLQISLLNIARLRFLSRARAVLNTDVDELVWTASGASIFDMAARTPLGMVRFGGAWRYRAPATPSEDIPRHVEHVFGPDPIQFCATKYCIRPRSLLGRLSWGIHKVNGARQKTQMKPGSAGFWHMREISDGWKGGVRLKTSVPVQPDPAMSAWLKRGRLHGGD